MRLLLYILSLFGISGLVESSQYTPHLNGKQHGAILYTCWGPLALITSLVIRNCKYCGLPVAAVHGILGQIILWSSVLAILDKGHFGDNIHGIKGFIGIMNLVILGLIEGTAITMTVLKNITVDLNVKCLNYVRYVHMFLGVLGFFSTTIAMWEGLHLVKASSPLKQATLTNRAVWFLSYPLYVVIFFYFEYTRKKGLRLKKFTTKANLPVYTLDRFEHELTGGKKLVLLDNEVIELPLLFDRFHPGGRKLILESIGKDIGRYFVGGYQQQGQQYSYAHNPETVQYLKSRSIGALTNNAQFHSSFFGDSAKQIGSFTFQLVSRTPLTPIVSRLSFSSESFSRALYLNDPFFWGKHFKFTTKVPWDKSIKGYVSRYYTFAFSLGEEFLKLVDQLIIKFKQGDQFKFQKPIGEQSVNTIDAFPKCYNYPSAYSRYLHQEARERKAEFQIEGPMGFGLRLNKGANGAHVAITAGTGIVPFLDLVFYLLRRDIYQLGLKQGRNIQIFQDQFEAEVLEEGFNLILFSSFSKAEEVIALKYIRALQAIEEEHQLFNFKFFLRISGESLRWDEDYFEKWIPVQVEKVWVRGPEKFNQQVKQMLKKIGYAKEKILET